MTTDLRPATGALALIVKNVRDDQLGLLTPCGGITVGALLDHIGSLCVAFAAAAGKQPLADGGQAPVPDASRLGADWRDRLPARLTELGQAWQPAAAWNGITRVGGGEMPGPVAGAAAADEVIVHGWDLAAATGQPFPGSGQTLGAALPTAYAWADEVAGHSPGGTPGLFGPSVGVPGDAPLLDRLLGLTGRDPGWRPA